MSRFWTLCLLFVASCCVGWAATGDTDEVSGDPASASVLTNAVLQKVEYPKSEFSIEPAYGRDPFFPASTRRTVVAAPVIVEPKVPESKTQLQAEATAMANTFDPSKASPPAADNDLAFLSVKGIIATTSSRVITLHTSVRSYIFRTGDAMTVRVPDGRLRVRCLEIRGRSGVFQVEGYAEPVELRLSEK